MIVKMVLYGLKSSRVAFRAKLTGVLHDIGYTPSNAYPDVWLRPAVKTDGAEYYEMVLCYVDEVLKIPDMPMGLMYGIRSVLKPKDYKAEVPDAYLGAMLSQVENETVTKCWSMYSENYVKAAIDNL